MENHNGFTLFELLGVLFILALLLNPGIPIVNKTIYNVKEAVCISNRETILRAYGRYNYFHDSLNLAEIINENNWPSAFEMDKDHRYCPLAGEYYVDENGEILCSIHDSGIYPDDETFYEFITEEDVFLYSGAIACSSVDNVSGDNATIFISDTLTQDDVNLGANIAVSNMYIDGDMIMNSGSTSFGSQTNPGLFIINGDLIIQGNISMYASEIYVSGNILLKNSLISATIYAVGNVELGWGETTLLNDTKIYYGGSITHPPTYSHSILEKVVHVDETSELDSIPTKEIPAFPMPNTKTDQWYIDNGYVSGGDFESYVKIYAEEFIKSSTNSTITSPIEDVIIVAKNGNIEITGQSNKAVKGFLFAPKGKVILGGLGSFEGIVIARDGFEVLDHNPLITFITIEEIFPNEEDIPFN